MKKIIKKLFGRAKGQKLFGSLFELSLKGLNYGNGGDFKESGELHVLRYVKEKFTNEDELIVFDVGANQGNYTKAICGILGKKAYVHAFEPSRQTYSMFLETNKDMPNVRANNFGLSDVQNNQLLYTDANGSGLASVYKRNLEHFGMAMDKSEEIKLSTIDAYCKSNNIARIHFLKLDIEGHELKALIGAKKMLEDRRIDVIQFEFGGCNIDSRTYFQDFYYLLKDNYKIYRVVKDGLQEIKEYKETHEIFITINYLAVKR